MQQKTLREFDMSLEGRGKITIQYYAHLSPHKRADTAEIVLEDGKYEIMPTPQEWIHIDEAIQKDFKHFLSSL